VIIQFSLIFPLLPVTDLTGNILSVVFSLVNMDVRLYRVVQDVNEYIVFEPDMILKNRK
jgi:hypothetical protein